MSVCLWLGSKYCPLLESEGGLSLLEPLAEIGNSRFHQIPKLAQQILRRCRQFRLSAESHSTEDLDDLSAPDANNAVDMSDESDNDVMDDDSDDNSGLDCWSGLSADIDNVFNSPLSLAACYELLQLFRWSCYV